MGRDERLRAIVSAPEPELALFLSENDLARPGEEGTWTPLSGGVSSDIWRVETSQGMFCIKRALAKLKVAADWQVDTGRNAYEWAYMRVVGETAPGAVPQPIAHDPGRGLFAMAWLDPAQYRLWKSDLLAGRVDVAFSGKVGDLLGRIHAATARDASIPQRFATDVNFHALRLDPYFLETGRQHGDLAERFHALAGQTAGTRHVLVHGDVSPKNILIGPEGPVLLDAEVAWFGDPAFDLAFCLNHLVIKARVIDAADALAASFGTLASAYLSHVDWETPQALEARAARLLPALALARVDGKSPVEYLDDGQRNALRAAAVRAISTDSVTLEDARLWLTGRMPA